MREKVFKQIFTPEELHDAVVRKVYSGNTSLLGNEEGNFFLKNCQVCASFTCLHDRND
jgi:hypothetical protein